MSNKPLDGTDVPASDEIIGEIYSTLERSIIFIVIYVVSLILCSIYLFWSRCQTIFYSNICFMFDIFIIFCYVK